MVTPGTTVRRGEAGYNLVVLAVALTVMSILVLAAYPLWSQTIRRDREEELIARGLQYAEAIRVFRQRFGRLPVRLAELAEVEPRCIRRLWKDPMTEHGRWAPVFAGLGPAGEPPGEFDPQGRPQRKGGDGRDDDAPSNELDPNAPPESGEEVAVGAIIGVRSRSTEESVLEYCGQTRYDRWIFHADIFAQRMNPLGIPNVAPSFIYYWWRPLRGGAQAACAAMQAPTMLPDGTPVPPPPGMPPSPPGMQPPPPPPPTTGTR